MPLYEYECVIDGICFEAFSSIAHRDNVVCPVHHVQAKRLLSRTHTPKGATESAMEALGNEGYDLRSPPTLSDLKSEIEKTQRALDEAIGTIKQRISPA